MIDRSLPFRLACGMMQLSSRLYKLPEKKHHRWTQMNTDFTEANKGNGEARAGQKKQRNSQFQFSIFNSQCSIWPADERQPTAAFAAAIWPASGLRAQHVEHDRHRPVHYHSGPDVHDQWRGAAMHAGLDRRPADRHPGWHGLERARRRDAQFWRVLCLSARRVRTREMGTADVLLVHLAIHLEWPDGNRLGICRDEAVLAFSGC